jgi:O-acetyl-ADP-ribose deacetylase (regulator of RNase III)
MCARGAIRPGHIWHTRSGSRIVLFAATKNHWSKPSELEWIRMCLERINEFISEGGVPSIAVPALGCGLGGLAWSDVRPLTERILIITDCDVRVYEPH